MPEYVIRRRCKRGPGRWSLVGRVFAPSAVEALRLLCLEGAEEGLDVARDYTPMERREDLRVRQGFHVASVHKQDKKRLRRIRRRARGLKGSGCRIVSSPPTG